MVKPQLKSISCPFQKETLWCYHVKSANLPTNAILEFQCERTDCPRSPKYSPDLLTELHAIYHLLADSNLCRYEAGLRRMRFLIEYLEKKK
jgi:hypothetical protein